MFKVRIADTVDVTNLREFITQEEPNDFRDVGTVDLDLHKASLPDNDELDKKLGHPMLDASLHLVKKLSMYSWIHPKTIFVSSSNNMVYRALCL